MTRQSMHFDNPGRAAAGIVGIAALALTLVFGAVPEASARESECLAHDSLSKLLSERHAEKSVAAGLEAGGRLVELFVSADSASWTMVATTPAGESCVMAVGEHWQKFITPAPVGPAA